jgi:hypothetical protein
MTRASMMQVKPFRDKHALAWGGKQRMQKTDRPKPNGDSLSGMIKENRAARLAWAACGGAEREACGVSLSEEQKAVAKSAELSDGGLLMAYQEALRRPKDDPEGRAQAEAYLKIPKRMRKGSKTK